MVTKTISFVRPSAIPLLYEHLNVYGQGRAGEAVYAKTTISGSMSQSNDRCISEEDDALAETLATDMERRWTLLRNKQEAVAWEEKLSKVADLHCRATAESKGSAVLERLRPAFSAMQLYIANVGDMHQLLASEFRFFEQTPTQIRIEAQRLASLIGNVAESTDDIELACLVLHCFAPQVEGAEDAFRGSKWHEDPQLRTRIYLLADFIREHRKIDRT